MRGKKPERITLQKMIRYFRTKDPKASVMEMCITGYGIMDNSTCSTWKS